METSSSACPCGCERRSSPTERRIALHAVDIAVGVGLLEAGEHALLHALPPGRREAVARDHSRLVDDGHAWAAAMLAWAHGDRRSARLSAFPSPTSLGRWRRACRAQVRGMAAVAPEVVAEYCRTLGAGDRRLVVPLLRGRAA